MIKYKPQLSLIFLCLLLILVPIPKGGMLAGFLPVFILICWALFVVWMLEPISIFGKLIDSDSISKASSDYLIPWLAFSLVVACHLLVIPHIFGIEYMLPNDGRDWASLVSSSSPVDIYEGVRQWVFVTCLWIVFCYVANLNVSGVRVLIAVVFIAASFQATYGVFFFISDANNVLGLWEKEYYLNDTTGTFVNRNHFAGFLAVCWPIVLSAFVGRERLFFRRPCAKLGLLVAFLFSMVVMIALLSSHSRMGLMAAFSGLVVWLVLFFQDTDRKSFEANRLVFLILAVISVIFVIWYGIEDILSRFITLESGDSRFEIWSAMFDMPLLGWLIGAGPGSFNDLFAQLQPAYFTVHINYAHNDYLEFVFEYGLIGTILILIGVYSLFVRQHLSEVLKDKVGVRAGALGSLTAIAVHSLVDFNMQILAPATYVAVIGGIYVNRKYRLADQQN